MSKTVKCLIVPGILLVLTSNALAADNNWNPADKSPGGDRLWSNPANWELGLPAKGDGNRPRIETGIGDGLFCVLDSPATADRMYVGDDSDKGLFYIQDGADLTIGRCDIGDHNGAYGEIRMSGGTVNAENIWKVGKDGSGKIVMTGGLLIIDAAVKIPSDVTDGSNTGHIQLDGGTLSIGALELGMGADGVTSRGTGTIDITTGTLIIDGNDLYDDGDGISGSNVDDRGVYTHIAAGRITAYNGRGTLFVDYDVTNPGKTTLTALHKFNPIPADGGVVGAGAVELSWTLPDPCVPGQPVQVDVYFTDDYDALWQFTNPEAMRVVNRQNVTSVVVQTQPKTQYYWAVDTYVGDPNDPILGSVFRFTADNMPPRVDAGADLVTWLVDGVMTKNLDATVTDEEATTVQWTVVSEPDDLHSPDAVIADPSAEDTSITLSALGEYVLQLEASDGEYAGSDTVTINVYNDGCEAARSLPNYEPFPGDLNGDCRVDDLDLAILQEDWLKDNSLTEP